METYIFEVASRFIPQGFHPFDCAIGKTVDGITSGETDTCTFKGEEWEQCGVLHLIVELGLSRPSDNLMIPSPLTGEG